MTFDELLNRSVKVINTNPVFKSYIHPFFPWKRIKFYWSSEEQNCYRFVSYHLDMEETNNPKIMKENLRKLFTASKYDSEKLSLISFYDKNKKGINELSHTGFGFSCNHKFYIISRYGNENGIYAAKIRDVRKYYGLSYVVHEIRPEFSVLPEFNEVNLRKVVKEINRLDNDYYRKFKKFIFLSSHFT